MSSDTDPVFACTAAAKGLNTPRTCISLSYICILLSPPLASSADTYMYTSSNDTFALQRRRGI